MQIILTVNYSPWSAYSGGGQRSTHNLAKTFARKGHKVTVIFSKVLWENIDVPDNLPYKIKWANLYNTHSKRNDIFRPLSSYSVAKIAGTIISDEQDTIIHSNGEEGGQIHTLFDHHAFGFISTSRYSYYPPALGRYKEMNMLRKAAFLAKEGKYVYQARAIRHAHYCSPPSRWAADKIQSLLELNNEKMQPVHNGVPEEFLKFHRKKKALNGPIIFFGRFAHDKGVDTLIEALSQIKKKKLPNIHIIGRGDWEEKLKKMVEKLSLGDKVIFKDWMSHDELGKELSKAKMTVLPSRDENFSLAILSALCVGSPTISTTVGGTPEIISDEETGLLVPPSNPDALATAIKFLLDNPEKREHIAKKGADHVRQNLTWNDSCANFEKLYKRSLKIQS